MFVGFRPNGMIATPVILVLNIFFLRAYGCSWNIEDDRKRKNENLRLQRGSIGKPNRSKNIKISPSELPPASAMTLLHYPPDT